MHNLKSTKSYRMRPLVARVFIRTLTDNLIKRHHLVKPKNALGEQNQQEVTHVHPLPHLFLPRVYKPGAKFNFHLISLP